MLTNPDDSIAPLVIVATPSSSRRSPTSGRRAADRRRRASHAGRHLADAERPHRRAGVLQVRKPSARRRLQVPRRLQRAVAALARRAAARRRSPSRPAITRRRSRSPGSLLDIPRVIVMPTDAPGGQARGHAKDTAARSSSTIASATIAKRSDAASRTSAASTLIPPYDHADVIAGQGTAAVELIEDAGPLDFLLVPCGGGGLLSGCALAARALAPALPRHRRRTGGRRRCDAIVSDEARCRRVDNPQTVADGARTPSLGSLTFPLVLEYVYDMTTVDDRALLQTMFLLWERLKLVVEPTGALGAAAALAGSLPIAGAARRRDSERRQRRSRRCPWLRSRPDPPEPTRSSDQPRPTCSRARRNDTIGASPPLSRRARERFASDPRGSCAQRL